MKETLNLPQTDFPMKADLAKREPQFIEFWHQNQCYQSLLENRKNAKRFVLNDGPPYANGPIHLGHAVNKILKDFIVKSKNLEGYYAPFVPGWDCHGLPIEVQVERKFGRTMEPSLFRQHCRQYASEQIQIQAAGFKRLGVQADWDAPYTTMDSAFEANIVRQFKAMFDKNLIKPGLKPVHWCPHCQSSLSEAETEFAPKVSQSIDVSFAFHEPQSINGTLMPASVVIWTTTPWTLPSNQAVAFGPRIDYVAVVKDGHAYYIAADLIEASLKRWGWTAESVTIHPVDSSAWQHQGVNHPLYKDKVVPLLKAEHVTVDTGTGFVHTAPDHGPEDYEVGRSAALQPLQFIDAKGNFIASVPDLAGMSINDAEPKVIELLSQRGVLLSHHPIEHSYLVCWRHKKPIFYRATPQWFVSLSPAFKQQIISAIHRVNWQPHWGAQRMELMIQQRPDWCISRQRHWGTPLVLIYDSQTYAIHPDMSAIIERVAQAIEERGLEAWFSSKPADWGVQGANWISCPDTLDVWFDSGSVFHLLLRDQLSFPADLYLEGTDQYRGWFQSSLICSMGRLDQPPYKAVLTHGFIVDKDGRKFSKSLGNGISPFEIADKYGIDVLRLWVATCDYREEMAIGDEILSRTSDSYRRIRNTLRFMLSNLYDFDKTDALPVSSMAILDRYFLYRIAKLQEQTRYAYEIYDFDAVARSLIEFCVNELGSDYLDIIKDRLYTSYRSSQARRSCQTTLDALLVSMMHQLVPIVPFTAEDAWQHYRHKDQPSLLLKTWPDLSYATAAVSEQEIASCERVLALKKSLQPQLEALRQQGVIGSALEARVTLTVPTGHWLLAWVDELKFIFLVSVVEVLVDNNVKDVEFSVAALDEHHKCSRCWHRVPVLIEETCPRCHHNITAPGETRNYG